MTNNEQTCYIYIQMPETLETVPCASLKVRVVAAGARSGSNPMRLIWFRAIAKVSRPQAVAIHERRDCMDCHVAARLAVTDSVWQCLPLPHLSAAM